MENVNTAKNRIQLTAYYIQITADATDPVFMRLVEELGCVYPIRTRNTYRCSIRKLPEVLHIMRGIDSAEQLTGSIREVYEHELVRRYRTKLLKEYGPDRVDNASLWKHQQLGIELAKVNKRYNFFFDTRTGKTRMALQIMLDAIKAGEAKRCLVVCPATIVQSWLSDAKEFPELKVVAYYKNAATQQHALTTPAHIIIWSAGSFANNIELLKSIHFDICFFDESSKLKNYASETSKAAIELSTHIPSWYNLSATPAPNGKYEYYTQMRVLDPYCFNPAVTKFNNKYFNNISRNTNYTKLVMRPEMDKAFMDIIEDYSVYVDQSVMPTAGKEWHIVPFSLDAATQRQYDSMRSNMALEISNTVLTAKQAAIMRAKLNQITSGFVLDTVAIKENAIARKLKLGTTMQQEVYTLSDVPVRISILDKLLNTLHDEQAVIWANYAQEFTDIKKLLGDTCVVVRGGSSTQEKEDALQAFRTGKVKYIVCHPLSIGMGIRLTEAHHAIYYSMTDSWEALKQSSERIYGHIDVQPNKCHYWIIQAENTVDSMIFNNVANKRDASTGFLEYLKAGALE